MELTQEPPTQVALVGHDAAHIVYWMLEPAYKDLCGRCDDYEAAQEVAIAQDYKDRGYIKQPNGEWHPTPEILKEMEASS